MRRASNEFGPMELIKGMGSHYLAQEGDSEGNGLQGPSFQKQALRRESSRNSKGFEGHTARGGPPLLGPDGRGPYC